MADIHPSCRRHMQVNFSTICASKVGQWRLCCRRPWPHLQLTVSLDRGMDVCGAEQTMAVETKFLRLYQPATLGEQIDGWKVCWLGGWGKGRLFYWVMVTRVKN